jgi:predicted metal-dependent RNase
MSSIRFIPLGGANEIGASCGLLEAYDARVVIDAGLRPNAGATDRYPDFARLAAAGEPHAALVTHAHMDHTGGLPILLRRFPDIPFFATEPTIRIALTVLRDGVHIMERDWDGPVDYTRAEVEALARAMTPVAFREPRLVAQTPETRVTASFVRAGHILGAAMLAVEIEHLPTGRYDRVLFSGDVSSFSQPTILGTDLEAVRGFAPGLLVCEGTYGAEDHAGPDREALRLVADVAEVLRRGGKVLIPAFAVGRAQNVALILREAIRDPASFALAMGEPGFTMPRVRIFVDGMCRSICDHYDAFRNLLNPLTQPGGRATEHVFFDSEGILRPAGKDDRDDLMALSAPVIVIASSGMLNGGPSVSYARAFAADPRNACFLVGYQDEESGGGAMRRLIDQPGGQPRMITLGDETVDFRCEVRQYGLSAHSDARGIEALVEAVRPARTALVHGTPRRLSALRARLQRFAEDAGIPTEVSSAHTGEPLEVETPAASRHPFLAEPFPRAGAWIEDLLTGRAVSGASRFSPVTPWISASLTHGGSRPLSDEDVARLQRIHPSDSGLGADDVALARDTLSAGRNALWTSVRVGRDRMHLPSRSRGGSLAQIHEATRKSFNQSLRGAGDLDAHWARVRAHGVSVGDLILTLGGRRQTTRVIPAVTVGVTEFGFRVVAPGATDSAVGVNQVLCRVGKWVNPLGVGGAAGALSVDLLAQIGRAVSVFSTGDGLLPQRDSSPGRPRPAGLTAELSSLSRMLAEGAVAPLPFSLAIQILAQWKPAPGSTQRARFSDLHALVGGPRSCTPAELLRATEDLSAAGILDARIAGDDLEVRWVLGSARDPLIGHRDPALDRLGEVFERLLRDAFLRALGEARQLGVQQGESLAWLGNPPAEALPLARVGRKSAALPVPG